MSAPCQYPACMSHTIPGCRGPCRFGMSTLATPDPAVQALVEAARDALSVLEEYHLGASSPVMCDLVSALAAFDKTD